jgi:hypothetical protein
MEFLVAFGVNIPDEASESEVRNREDAEAAVTVRAFRGSEF